MTDDFRRFIPGIAPGASARRRPEAATEQTGSLDVAELFRRLDELDGKVSQPKRPQPTKPKRPMSWAAALTIVLVVLGVLATVVLLAALHIIPALG